MMKKVMVIGMNPSSIPTKVKVRKNSTFDKLNRWMDEVGIKHYSFMNTFDEVSLEPRKSKVDESRFSFIDDNYIVFALGSFASDVLRRLNIQHHRLPHPSPRNHLFNDKSFEGTVIAGMKNIIKESK